MIDEDYIRNLIGGADAPPELVPKQTPAAPPRKRQGINPANRLPLRTKRRGQTEKVMNGCFIQIDCLALYYVESLNK